MLQQHNNESNAREEWDMESEAGEGRAIWYVIHNYSYYTNCCCRENTRGKWTPLYESQFDESVVGVIKLNGNDCTISFYIKEIFSVARGQNLKTVFHFVVNDFIFDNLTLFNLEIKSFHHKYFHHKFYEKLLLGKLSEVSTWGLFKYYVINESSQLLSSYCSTTIKDCIK